MVLKSNKTGHRFVEFGYFFILILFSILLVSNAASAVATGWVAPSSNVGGTGVTSPQNAYVDDSSYASFNGGGSSNWNYYDYDFSSIPTGATIDGIEVNALGSRISGSASSRYMRVRLSWNGGTTWTSYSTDTTEWSTSVANHFLGGAADKWGRSWTRDEIANSFRIQAQWMASSTSSDANLDYIPVQVYYTLGTGTTYSVSGIVTNASNSAVISGAAVSVDSIPPQSNTTDGSGSYSFLLGNGTYTIAASKNGYNSNSIPITVNGAPVTNADIALTPMPPSSGGQIIVATNRYVILDDPISSGKTAQTAAGFALPWSGSSSWGRDDWSTSQTTIKGYALVLSTNGTPLVNSPVVFTVRNWNSLDKTTSTSINTDANGLASYSLDLDTKNYYGNWYVDANATAIGKTSSTGFIYNWWGCNAGGCRNHGSNSPGSATPSKQNSPYTLGREGATGLKNDHVTSDADCVGCHRGYAGVGGGTEFTGQASKTADVHTTNTCATCHGITINTHETNALIKSCSDCHSWANLTIENTMSSGTTPLSNYSGNTAAAGHNPTSAIPCIICHGPMHNITKPDETLRLANNNIVEDSHCTTCHTTYNKHNGGVNCTLCHSQDIHDIKVFSQSANYISDVTNAARGNCTNCHQNASFLNTLKSAPKAGSYTGSAPQVQIPLNHSTDGAGTKWGTYWTNTKDACIYCHGDNKHVATRLGNAAVAVGTDPIGGAIGSGTICASCHNSTDNDYAAIMALLSPDPVAFKPGTNWNTSGTDHASYGTTDADCKSCHGGVLSGSADISEFVHNVDVGKGGDDCIGCHTTQKGNFPGIDITKFTKHKNINTTGGSNVITNDDCKTCHTDISNMYNPGFNVVTKTCSDCHAGGQYGAKVIDNHKQNGVNISTGVSCALCHNNSVNSSFAYSDNATVSHYTTKTNLISTQDCTNCHKNSVNGTTWGNALDPAGSPSFPHSISNTPTGDCYTCHKSAINFHNITLEKPPVSTVTCLDCHKTTATMAPKKIDGTVIATGVHKNQACENCHTNATDTNMNNYLFSSDPARTCTYCHVNSSNLAAPQVAEHNQVGQDAITSNATCTTCHNNSGMYLSNSGTNGTTSAITHYLKDVTNKSTTPYQHFGPINTANCIDCHNGPNTSNPNWGNPTNISNSTIRPHTETLTSQCDTCHNDGTVSTLANVDFHNKSIKRAPADDCIGCHKNAVGIYAAINTASFTKHENVNTTGGQNNLTNDDCKTCHTDISNMYNPGWTTPTKVCSDCHTGSGQYGAKVIDNHRQNGVNITTGASCATCHNNSVNSTFAYSGNATVSHYATKTNLIATQDCTNCHKNSVNGTTWGNALDPAASPSFPHSISNTPTGDCYICHKSAINFHNKTLEKPPVSTVTCLDCHKTTATMAPKKIDAAVIATGVHKNRACENCHAGATNTNMNTYSFTTDPARACTYCHTGAGNFSAPLVAEHNQNGQDVRTVASCTTCHNNSGMFLSNSGTNGTTTAITHYLKDVTNTATTPYQHFGPINTSDCIDCHNGPNTSNPNWGDPVNISTSIKRQHTETLTSECNICHSDGGASLANVDFHNASVQLGAGGCTGCHSNVNSVALGLHSTLNGTSVVDDGDCTTCHYASFQMVTGAANSTNTYYCQACHTTTGTGPVKSTLLKDGLSHGKTDCKWCHVAGDQPAYKYHPNGPKGTAAGQDCITCHYNANLQDIFHAPGEKHSSNIGGCGDCHDSAVNHAVTYLDIGTAPTLSSLSVATPVTTGNPALVQVTVFDNMMQIAAAQYQVTNVSGTVIPWTNMTPADGRFDYTVEVVEANIDTTNLKGTYTINVKGMAAAPKTTLSAPYYPLNGVWSSVSSTQFIVTESKGYINGTVRNNSVNIPGAIVTTNTGVTAISDSNGFYSLSLTNGTYQLTTIKEPEFYTNSVSATVTAPGTTTRNIILNRKPTGNISGKVTVK